MPEVKRSRKAQLRSDARRRVGGIAVELFLTQGFEATTAEQIAAAAGISRRTFFRYFATKEEALFAWLADIGMALAEVVRARPAGEPIAVILRAALQYLVDYAQQDVERLRALTNLTGSNGLFPSAQAAKKELWLTNLTSALAARMPASDHAGAALHVTIALSAFDWAIARWLVDPTQDLSRMVDEAFQLVRATFDGAEPGFSVTPQVDSA